LESKKTGSGNGWEGEKTCTQISYEAGREKKETGAKKVALLEEEKCGDTMKRGRKKSGRMGGGMGWDQGGVSRKGGGSLGLRG